MTDPRQTELEERRRRAMIKAQDDFDAAMQAPRRRFENDTFPFKQIFQAEQTAREATRQAAFDAADEELAAGLRLLAAEQKASTDLRCTHCGWVGTEIDLVQITSCRNPVCPVCKEVRSTVEKVEKTIADRATP